MAKQDSRARGWYFVEWVAGSFFLIYSNFSKKLNNREATSLIFIPLAVLLLIPLFGSNAAAAEATITPKIAVAGGYEDNIFLSSQNEMK